MLNLLRFYKPICQFVPDSSKCKSNNSYLKQLFLFAHENTIAHYMRGKFCKAYRKTHSVSCYISLIPSPPHKRYNGFYKLKRVCAEIEISFMCRLCPTSQVIRKIRYLLSSKEWQHLSARRPPGEGYSEDSGL